MCNIFEPYGNLSDSSLGLFYFSEGENLKFNVTIELGKCDYLQAILGILVYE